MVRAAANKIDGDSMKTTTFALAATVLLAGCASQTPAPIAVSNRAVPAAMPVQGSGSANVDAYKLELAHRIASINADKVYSSRPQSFLRSVVVVRYSVDGNGRLVRSEIMRSNHDAATEAIALASLRNSAPFPKPANRLLQGGRVELSETWLFNSDGRFQLRSIAQRQMDE